ncbi:MAG: hypothetical protein ACT6QM_05955 [Brevundimonas mediterranea]|uniref:hypothetical protein n=1 Tax=Brevundimonas mediterranea TaxID=74329 RepID=UPI0040335141
MNRDAKVYRVRDDVRKLPMIIRACRETGIDPDNISMNDMTTLIARGGGTMKMLDEERTADRRKQDEREASFWRRIIGESGA